MQRVLSTKLQVDQVERFEQVAEAQGESKSGLVRRLVLDYLNGGSKADRVASTGTSSPANSSNKDLLIHGKGLHSEYLPHDPNQKQTETLTTTSGVGSCLPSSVRVDRPLNPAPLRTSGQLVHYNAEPRRPAVSPKQSSGIGWLILLGIISAWYLRSQSVDAVDRTPKRLAQGIGAGICRQLHQSGYNSNV
jgi:hypothetical protein